MTTIATELRTGQQILDYATEHGLSTGVLLRVTEAMHSPNPIAAVEWFLAAEEDETARCGYQAALDVLRRREITNTACARCDSDTEAAPTSALAPSQPGRLVCATLDGQVGEAACGVSDLQLAIFRHLHDAGHQDGPSGSAAAALNAAKKLADSIVEALASYYVGSEQTAWTLLAHHALAQAAERVQGDEHAAERSRRATT